MLGSLSKCRRSSNLENNFKMNLGSCFIEVLLLVPIMTNYVAENGTPVYKISNEVTTATTESNAAKPELECFDLYGEKKCKELRDHWKFCKYAGTNLMNEMCRKTCGFCKTKDDCTTSKYKCCEDGITTKSDLQGSNCPGCKDKHSELCKKYAKDCNDLGWAGLWMQANCRRTCQLCKEKPTCSDDKEQERFCPSWKKYGMCNIHASYMRTHCAKTCGFCDPKQNGDGAQRDQNAEDKKSTSSEH